MSNRPLLVHELLCLHLRSFYGEAPRSVSPKVTPAKPAGK